MFIFDGHCDSLSRYTDKPLDREFGERQFDFAQAEGLSWVEMMAVFSWRKARNEIRYEEFAAQCERLERELPKEALWLKEEKDWKRLKERQLGVMLSVEGGEFLEGRPERLYEMRARGMRMMGLTWNGDNALCGGCARDTEGLSGMGRDVVRILGELGVVIDGAHMSHIGLREVLRGEERVVVSHTACNGLCAHRRNLTDEEIKEVARHDGVVGICFVDDFLYRGGERKATVADAVEHIVYAAELVGSEHVAIGSDFDGVDRPLAGMEKAGFLLRLPAYLRARGFAQEDIENVMGRNWRRVFGGV